MRQTISPNLRIDHLVGHIIQRGIDICDIAELIAVAGEDHKMVEMVTDILIGERGWKEMMMHAIPRIPRFFFSSLGKKDISSKNVYVLDNLDNLQ